MDYHHVTAFVILLLVAVCGTHISLACSTELIDDCNKPVITMTDMDRKDPDKFCTILESAAKCMVEEYTICYLSNKTMTGAKALSKLSNETLERVEALCGSHYNHTLSSTADCNALRFRQCTQSVLLDDTSSQVAGCLALTRLRDCIEEYREPCKNDSLLNITQPIEKQLAHYETECHDLSDDDCTIEPINHCLVHVEKESVDPEEACSSLEKAKECNDNFKTNCTSDFGQSVINRLEIQMKYYESRCAGKDLDSGNLSILAAIIVLIYTQFL